MIISAGGDVLELVQMQEYFKCSLCGSKFPSMESAYKCCKRAKAQILCSRFRERFQGEVEQQCNIIKASILGKPVKARL